MLDRERALLQRCSEKAHRKTKDLYVLDRTVRHIGSGPYLRYVVRRYDYGKAEDAAKPPHHILRHFIDSYWHRLDKR